jgi:hypothetical protein
MRCLIAFVIAVCVCATAEAAPRPLLVRHDGGFHSRNGLEVSISAFGMRPTATETRREVFSAHPYVITLAGFIGERQAVLVHAEHVEDVSGASNYEDLPVAAWPERRFRQRDACTRLSESDIAGEHDLEWLRANGFDPRGPIVLAQSFLTTIDHNNEVVISVVVKGVDCADNDAVLTALARVRENVRVSVIRTT